MSDSKLPPATFWEYAYSQTSQKDQFYKIAGRLKDVAYYAINDMHISHLSGGLTPYEVELLDLCDFFVASSHE